MIPKLPDKPFKISPGLASSDYYRQIFEIWYAELEAWHKQVFQNAVEVYGHEDNRGIGWHYVSKQCYADTLQRGSSHKALLINISPIKEETANDHLVKLVAQISEMQESHWIKITDAYEHAKAFLEKKK